MLDNLTYDRRKPVDQRITRVAATEPIQNPEKRVSIVRVVTVNMFSYPSNLALILLAFLINF